MPDFFEDTLIVSTLSFEDILIFFYAYAVLLVLLINKGMDEGAAFSAPEPIAVK